jgi:3',5'-cyclic AMP phosphodiesterase CpdA
MVIVSVGILVVLVTGVFRGDDGSYPELVNARTRIASDPQRDVRFAVFGDVQGGYATLNNIIDAIEQDGGFDFAMCAGDMVEHPTQHEYDAFCSSIVSRKHKTPYIFIPGNHDESRSDNVLFRKYFGDPYYSFTVGKTLFVALNNGEETYLPQQLEWLEALLKQERAKFDSLILFMHRPPIAPANAWTKDKSMKPDERDKLLAVVKDYSPTAIFSGHVHEYAQMNWDGIPVYICGGGGGNMEPGAQHHWLEVTVQNGTANVKMHPVTP